MAAVYSHNELFTETPSEAHDIQEHTRNTSTISSATLVTNTTAHSQPLEPLLPTGLPSSTSQTSYFPPAPYPPQSITESNKQQLRWGSLPTSGPDTGFLNEKDKWEGIRKSSAPWQRVGKLVLDVIIVAWSIYNIVRYFIAFTIYDSDATEGRSLSLSLGICSVVSVALVILTKALFLVKHRVSIASHTFRYLTQSSCVLRLLSSLFILSPAVSNFVVLFSWRNSVIPQYNIRNHCQTVAVDIVWSVSHSPCTGKSSPWGIWLVASSLRLAFTLAALVIYHILSFIHSDYPQRPLHHRLRSGSFPSTCLAGTESSPDGAIVHPDTSDEDHEPVARHQISDTTLAESYRPPSRMSRPRSYSSDISTVTTPTKSVRSGCKPSPPSTEDDHSTNFRSLLNQISQETDDAVSFAVSDTRPRGPSPTPSHPPGLQNDYAIHEHYEHYTGDYDDDDDHYDARHDAQGLGAPISQYTHRLPPIAPVLGYNEFGLPYPPEQSMRMLNGFIRRMPTIESMGSGELAASMRAGGSMYTASRPPTRNTLLSFTGSLDPADPASTPSHSRPNSLSARAELLAAMDSAPGAVQGASEHGELLGRPDGAHRRVASPTTYLDTLEPGHSGAADTYSSGGSRGTIASYHTATMGSTGDSYPATSRRSPS